LEKEQEREWAEKHGKKAISDSTTPPDLSSPIRRKWGGCPDGCNHRLVRDGRKKPVRKNTADLYRDDEDAVDSGSPGSCYQEKKSVESKKYTSHQSATAEVASLTRKGSGAHVQATQVAAETHSTQPDDTPHHVAHRSTATAATQTTPTYTQEDPSQHRLTSRRVDLRGRDGGGSGMTSRVCSDEEGDQEVSDEQGFHHHTHSMANVLGDGDDDYTPEDTDSQTDGVAESLKAKKEEDQSLRGSVY
jgi:hypothetical protein